MRCSFVDESEDEDQRSKINLMRGIKDQSKSSQVGHDGRQNQKDCTDDETGEVTE